MGFRLIFKLYLLFAVIFLGGVVFASENLTAKQQSIALIPPYTAKGDTSNLEDALNSGLENGLTVNEIKEVLVQFMPMLVFPEV